MLQQLDTRYKAAWQVLQDSDPAKRFPSANGITGFISSACLLTQVVKKNTDKPIMKMLGMIVELTNFNLQK